jgi:hypothetical protein
VTNHYQSHTVFVARSAEDLYDMVSDVTRMGEWSPVCKACWWDEGAGPSVGSWFSGRNVTPERTWEARCQVVAAERGREFAFAVRGNLVRWGYVFEPMPGGTNVTESWEILPDFPPYFAERFGDEAEAQLAERFEAARQGIPATLAAIKASAEAT